MNGTNAQILTHEPEDTDHNLTESRLKPLTLQLKKNGEPYPNLSNILMVLRTSPDWSNVLALDEFVDRKRIIQKPPFESFNGEIYPARDLRDDDYSQTLVWLNQNGFPTLGRDTVFAAVNLLCRDTIISPVRHYLESLEFDPENDEFVAETWMEDYLGVKPTESDVEYIQAVSLKSLVQAVARAFNPGCKADSVTILEGPQGAGKSTAIRVLFGAEWFGDALPPMGHKDASDYLKGKWAIELSEMSFQSKADIEQQKAFISRQEERYRPAYGREEITYPRRCVFWGTTNRDDYLKDETGNRRFWPVKTSKINIEGLRSARNKLWAEAVYHYRNGYEWWLNQRMQDLVEEQNSQRFERDTWEQDVIEWADQKAIKETTVREALNEALKIPSSKMTQADQRRMRTVFRHVGFQKDGVFKDRARRDQARYIRKIE